MPQLNVGIALNLRLRSWFLIDPTYPGLQRIILNIVWHFGRDDNCNILASSFSINQDTILKTEGLSLFNKYTRTIFKLKSPLKLIPYFMVLSFLFSSCAAHYRAIKPNLLTYSAHSNNEGISCSYKYNVLLERRNRKYSKKEMKGGVKLIAIKISNNTNKEIVVKDDLVFTGDNQQIFPLEPTVVKHFLGQKVGYYLFYLLLTPLTFYTADSRGNVESSYPVGLFLGPGLAIGNLVGAIRANKSLFYEYSKEYIINKTIGPGESVSGLMAIQTYGTPAISVVRIRNK